VSIRIEVTLRMHVVVGSLLHELQQPSHQGLATARLGSSTYEQKRRLRTNVQRGNSSVNSQRVGTVVLAASQDNAMHGCADVCADHSIFQLRPALKKHKCRAAAEHTCTILPTLKTKWQSSWYPVSSRLTLPSSSSTRALYFSTDQAHHAPKYTAEKLNAHMNTDSPSVLCMKVVLSAST
jgi:hypothetical protein